MVLKGSNLKVKRHILQVRFDSVRGREKKSRSTIVGSTVSLALRTLWSSHLQLLKQTTLPNGNKADIGTALCCFQASTEIITSVHLCWRFSVYCFVLKTLHKPLLSTTLYFKACTKCFPVHPCTQLTKRTSQYYLHNKTSTKHFPVLLCTTKLAQCTSQNYFVLHHTRAARHRQLQPLYTERDHVSCSGFLPNTSPKQRSCSHCALPFIASCSHNNVSHVLLCDHVLLWYKMLCYLLLSNVLLSHVLLCDVLLCDALLCDVLLCHVLLCGVLLCDIVMLCIVM